MRKSEDQQSPIKGWRRRLFRAPIYLFRWHLGLVVPGRFLYLRHIGRKSAEMRETVLEVAKYDEATDTYFVASGWGHTANWHLNLKANPAAKVQVRRRQFDCLAELLSPSESGQMMVNYAAQYPKVAKRLMSLVGLEADGSEPRYREIGDRHVPFVALKPSRSAGGRHTGGLG